VKARVFPFARRSAQNAAGPGAKDVTPLQQSSAEPSVGEHPPTPLPEPEPPPPEPAPPAPDPEPPAPDTGAPVPLQAVARVQTDSESEHAREQVADQIVVDLPSDRGEPREWNVWELEQLAQDAEGQDSARDEELGFLLLELRHFANAHGQLPVSFDPIVRESFGELLYAAI
jgi:hypothetical protein